MVPLIAQEEESAGQHRVGKGNRPSRTTYSVHVRFTQDEASREVRDLYQRLVRTKLARLCEVKDVASCEAPGCSSVRDESRT